MFFDQSPEWATAGTTILEAMAEEFGPLGLDLQALSLVMVTGGKTGPVGFAHRPDWRAYPCSLVKPFHLVHALTAIDAGRLVPHGDLDRALRDMILWSSNTATNYVIDLLTGTTGDTLLGGAEYLDWVSKREKLNRFFWAMGWPEWEGCSISQKLMDDTRYGREAQYAGEAGENLNALMPMAVARLLWDLFEGDLGLSGPAQVWAQNALMRSPDHAEAMNPAYQLAEYLGGDLPAGAQIWSKAGHNLWTGDARASWFKHDMIRMAGCGRAPLNVVLMTQGKGLAQEHPQVFPKVGRLIWDATQALVQA